MKPFGHTHENEAILSMHVALFKQGLESHSFTSMLQTLPLNKKIIVIIL